MPLHLQTSRKYSDAGFYYNAGTLNSLTLGSGIEIVGTPNTAVNLWVNPQDWTWSGSTFTSLGTDGAYGLGSSSGTTTVNGAYKFYITAAAAGSCLHSYIGSTISVATIQSACGSSTPIDIWVGFASTNEAKNATVYGVSYPDGAIENGNVFTFNRLIL